MRKLLCVGAQGYVLVLWGCDVGLLGLVYIVLLTVVFTVPPFRGQITSLAPAMRVQSVPERRTWQTGESSCVRRSCE